jgi:hypothetical protein
MKIIAIDGTLKTSHSNRCNRMQPPKIRKKIRIILDIDHGPVVYLKHDVSETGFCLRKPATTSIGFIEPTQHKPPVISNISTAWISALVAPSLYTHALFMANIAKSKILSEPKSSLKIQTLVVTCVEFQAV